MATAPTKLMTAEEFFDWANRPENRDSSFELERGEIVEVSRAGMRHGAICVNIAVILALFVRTRRKGLVCSNDTGIVVERDPDTVRGPDVLLYDNVSSFEDIEVKYSSQPPTLSVEVLSPNDTMGKMSRRISEQLGSGVRLVWLVDPEAKNVTVYRPGREPYVVEVHEELTGDDVLPDLHCKVAEFFTLHGR